jgi:hypothetical protein
MKYSLIGSIAVIVLSVGFTGCGGGTDGDASSGNSGGVGSTFQAYFSDSRIAGVEYSCGTLTGVTDENGTFQYNSGCSDVLFSIGGVFLGSIATANLDANAIFYPADLFGLDRNNTSDPQLVQTLQFLQSLDNDGRIDNGIVIDSNITSSLAASTLSLESNTTTIEDINDTLNNLSIEMVSREFAIANYEETLRREQNLSVNSIDQATLYAMEVARMKKEIVKAGGVNVRNFTYEPQWSIGDAPTIAFIEPMRSATTEDQTYTVTATLTKGSASDTVDINETVPFSQALRDQTEVAAMKSGLLQSNNPRTFTYTQQWSTGDVYDINFSEPMRSATTEDQTYTVTATLTKGSASDTVDFNETVPFSQLLRDQVEVLAIKNGLSGSSNPRVFAYTQQWNSGTPYTITFSEPRRIPTAVDQTYTVVATITKGNITDTFSFTETVPTTNVTIDLQAGDIAFINDQYQKTYDSTNGAIFEKKNEQNQFVGTAFSVDASTLGSSITSSQDLLSYMINNSGIQSSLSAISSSINPDGSLNARYEFNSLNAPAINVLEDFLSSFNYSITNLDLSQYTNLRDIYVDIYVENNPAGNSYVIAVVTDKTLSVEQDIVKIVNKDSIVQSSESIVNETESFRYTATQPKGDFIFVMDDSGSMAQEQAASIEAITRTFASATQKYNLDWKAYVIGTSVDNTYSSLIADPSIGDINKTSQQLNLGTYGSGTETGLKRAYYALNNDIVNRANANMNVIYISDEEDHSSLNDFNETDTDFSDSYFAQNNITFNTVIPEDYAYEAGELRSADYAYMMTLATGGYTANLRNYASGYDRMMDLAVRAAVAKSSPVKLTYPALASSITVFVDGVQQNGWEYDPNAYAIVFDANNTPALDANVTVVYSHLDYTSLIQSAKDEFDALSDDQKRSYSNGNVNVTFDPAQPVPPLADQNQTYTVTVTFSKFGQTETSTYTETVLTANYQVTLNTDWQQSGNTFTSQNHANNSASRVVINIIADTTLDYSVSSESGYDYLKIIVNGNYTSYSGNSNGSLNLSNGDTLELQYTKDGGVSGGDDQAVVTIH